MNTFSNQAAPALDSALSHVISDDHCAQLEEITARLAEPDLTPQRRSELLTLSYEIAALYECDPRLCE